MPKIRKLARNPFKKISVGGLININININNTRKMEMDNKQMKKIINDAKKAVRQEDEKLK